MRYIIAFLVCIAVSIVGVVVWLGTVVPPGEGSFGIAKAVPFMLMVFPPLIFCLLWFPANVIVFLFHRRRLRAENFRAEPYMLLIISGGLFAIVLTSLAIRFSRFAP